MAIRNELVYALNAGGVDRAALARVDLEKMRLSGEHPVKNWLPSVIGPMALRPGFESLMPILDSEPTRLVGMQISSSNGFILEVQDGRTRIIKDGEPITVQSSSSIVLNADFSSPAAATYPTGWVDESEVGPGTAGTATFGASGLTLLSTRYRTAKVTQAVNVGGADYSVPHTFRITVGRGPVMVRMGTGAELDDLVSESSLDTGVHKITVTPGGPAVYISIRSEDSAPRVVTSVYCEHTLLGGGGDLVLDTPWTGDDLQNLAWDQSADVLFIGDGARTPYRIEHRGEASWSIVPYKTRRGPWKELSTSQISITPSATTGTATLTATQPVFKAGHVGSLIELTHDSAVVSERLDAPDQSTNFVTVTGVATDRSIGIAATVNGGWTGSYYLQRSVESSDPSIFAVTTSYTTTTAPTTYNDTLDNVIAHYRFGLTSSGYGSGSYVDASITYSGSSVTGIGRITNYVSPTQVQVEVVERFGNTTSTRDFRFSAWSDVEGWPRVPVFHDGRLWWFRGDVAYGSIVDDYTNFDDTAIGDSGPITRTIGNGPMESTQWAVSVQRLIVGTSGFEASIRASSFDEPLTPTAFTVRNASTLGVSHVVPAKVDGAIVFVHASGKRLYLMRYSASDQDYSSTDITRLIPNACKAGVIDIAVQRYPDTRVYVVLGDGTCLVLTYEKEDSVVAFTVIETDGLIEDAVVLRNVAMDDVFFIVSRDGVRYLERLGQEANQESVETCATLDAYKVLESVSSITGATHLIGKTVDVWADGQRRSQVTISGGGTASLGATYARVVYGLGYDATFLSSKLAYAAKLGTAIGQSKKISSVGLLLKDSCLDGLRVGRDADNTDPMPDIVDGAERTPSQFFEHYDEQPIPIPGDWNVDSRVFISADSACGPVTILGIVLGVETHEGLSAQAGN